MAKRKALSQKDAAKARKVVGDAAASSLALSRGVGLGDCNTMYYDAVLQAVQVLAADAVFQDMSTLTALEIQNNDGCGIIAPYDHEEFLVAIKRRGVYVAGCTSGSFDLFGNPTPGVPLSAKAVADLRARDFAEVPNSLPVQTVQVRKQDIPSFDKKHGKYRLISPPERMHALTIEIASRISSGCSMEEPIT